MTVDPLHMRRLKDYCMTFHASLEEAVNYDVILILAVSYVSDVGTYLPITVTALNGELLYYPLVSETFLNFATSTRHSDICGDLCWSGFFHGL